MNLVRLYLGSWMTINFKKNKRTRESVQINVAPLVDVMLVLIIIFMITAPMLNVGVPVDLPQTKASMLNNDKDTYIIVSINKNSKIFIDKTKVTMESLIKKLSLALKKRKTDIVYVRGDKDLPYGKVMQLMGIITSSGCVSKVSLISELETSKNNMVS